FPFLHLFLIPPLVPSTLFPYTTLFRSAALVCDILEQNDAVAAGGADPGKLAAPVSNPLDHAFKRVLAERIVDRDFDFVALFDKPDRKSTRLNSSHVSISYAVFCLKKKT